jgi:hypothetical protein
LRTKKFLAFALGKREEKTDSEILIGIRSKAKNPMTDPLQPKLFRKFGGSPSNISLFKKNAPNSRQTERIVLNKLQSAARLSPKGSAQSLIGPQGLHRNSPSMIFKTVEV